MSIMTEPRLDEDHALAPSDEAIRLAQPVGSALAADSGDDAGLSRAFVIGSAIGLVAVFMLIVGLVLASGMDGTAAIGVGMFGAFWGGLGFGGMMAGVLHYSRTEAQKVDRKTVAT